MKKVSLDNLEEKYNNRDILTTVMDNITYVSESKNNYLDEIRQLSREEFGKKMPYLDCLYKSHIEKFTELFGKQDFIYKNEYDMYAWLVDHKGCEAIIFSGEGFGTRVEIVLNENNRPKGSVKEFFDEYWRITKTFVDE